MGEVEVDPAVIRKTQESLGKYVKKPPLTEKLLQRPPFKFIMDVVKVVRADDENSTVEKFEFHILLILQHHHEYRSNRNCFLVVIPTLW